MHSSFSFTSHTLQKYEKNRSEVEHENNNESENVSEEQQKETEGVIEFIPTEEQRRGEQSRADGSNGWVLSALFCPYQF